MTAAISVFLYDYLVFAITMTINSGNFKINACSSLDF